MSSMNSNNSKVTAYTMEGCGYCTDQKTHLSSEDKIINCSSTEGMKNQVCRKLEAFPTLSINGKLYQGLHTSKEISDIKKQN